jgi:hypothetical protein
MQGLFCIFFGRLECVGHSFCLKNSRLVEVEEKAKKVKISKFSFLERRRNPKIQGGK